jgi:formylglycine-generating enzyme required for sulfatase activity
VGARCSFARSAPLIISIRQLIVGDRRDNDSREPIRRTVLAGAGAVFPVPESLRRTLAVAQSVFSSDELRRVGQGERFLPVRELGQGGMGRVDVMFDRVMGRPIACKRLLEPEHAPLLHIEALICGQLEHPSIVPVYDVSSDHDGLPQYSMRVVNGRTLRDVLGDDHEPGARPLNRLLGILRQVCLAIDYAHSRGVIHRDLKPENVVVGEFGEVYVLDWGVAWLTPASDIRLPIEQPPLIGVAGSPGYMAPEQAVDARADVYALGAVLYEILTGAPAFCGEHDLSGVFQRTSAPSLPPPSTVVPGAVPDAFDLLVRACLRPDPAGRPDSARKLADAIELYLDSERARLDRERDADERVADGQEALETLALLEAEAVELREQSEEILATLRPWDPIEAKQPAWDLAERARRRKTQAALELAAAQGAFTAALSKVPHHPKARAGLAALHHREFLAAEAMGQAERVAQHLALARSYDDGPLELELSDEGALAVSTRPLEALLQIARYEPSGLVLRLGEPRPLEYGVSERLRSGSYVVLATAGDRTVRYPLVVERAKAFTLRLRMPAEPLPEGMVLVPGGPFLGRTPKGSRVQTLRLPDFAIGRFPVTFREYVAFLDDLGEAERNERMPGQPGWTLVEKTSEGWRLTDRCIEGAEARRRVPRGRELDLPVIEVSWFDACAYAEWLARKTGIAYRLPSDEEWEKALRGADGRAYPMGQHIDPSFAKLRASRPEASQPELVGAFPLDESPFGVRDLAGGVTEWTATSIDGAPLPSLAEESSPEASERQAYYRGGSWGISFLVPEMRYTMSVDRRVPGTGFRLAMSLAGSSELRVAPMKR